MLTVDWAGHKTVLVEVPASRLPKADEVEMTGMSSFGREQMSYGRLLDDDEEDVSDFDQPCRGGKITNKL